MELFEYRKTNKSYCNRFECHKQIVSKTLPIAQVLYLGYSFLFLFDNTIIYFGMHKMPSISHK